MKLVFATIIIGLIFNCVNAIPTQKRSNRVSREATLSLSKILTLATDCFKMAKDFGETMIDGMLCMGAITNMVTTIGSNQYRFTQYCLHKLEDTIDFGMRIPGEIENFTVDTVLAPYYLTNHMLNMIGQETMETVDDGIQIQKQIMNRVVDVVLLPYTTAKSLMDWIGL